MNPEKDPLTEEQRRVTDNLTKALQDDFETGLIDLLYELDEGPVKDYWVDETRGPNDEEDRGTVDRINALCDVLGIKPNEYSGAYVRGRIKNGFSERRMDVLVVKRAQRHGLSLGQLMVQRAIDALPIEMDEDGEGTAEIILRDEQQRLVTLASEGSFWTNYPPEDSDEDSEIEWSLRYKVSIRPDVQIES